MSIEQRSKELINAAEHSFNEKSFHKLSLGGYQGEEDLKNIYIKPVLIKKEEKLSFTYRHKTRDIVKNYSVDEAKVILNELIGRSFKVATLITATFELQFEIQNSGKVTLRKKDIAPRSAPALTHDQQKNRVITSSGKSYLFDLKITDAHGNVFQSAQDKYRQINHYIEVVSSLVSELPKEGVLKIADMGSGKGYLTFALFDYMRNVLGRNVEMTGVEFRQDLVELCNNIASNAGFDQLHFKEGTIQDYDSSGLNMLIALHACDTATDDAIFKGISANADLIVVAPCCHKQIRRQMENHKPDDQLTFLTRYGTFLERQAEMVTDGIRSLIMEYYGYKTKIFEFISDAHTPKNVMIVGMKDGRKQTDKAAILDKISSAKKFFGIDYHHLERLTGI